MRLYHWLMDLIFPRKCVLCQMILPVDQTDLCHDCRVSESAWDEDHRRFPYLDDYASVWFYEDQVRDSLHRFKFGGKRHYAKIYGRLLAMRVNRTIPDVDFITWVPVSAIRKRTRGYDQGQLLARALSSELDVPVVQTLKKIRNNPAQSGISDPEQRRRNVKNAYRLLEQNDLTGKRILLVDDILTTGATSSECARMLKGNGAEAVFLAVVASGRNKTKQ